MGGEKAVHHWDEATKGKKLPERVHKQAERGAMDALTLFGLDKSASAVDALRAFMRSRPSTGTTEAAMLARSAIQHPVRIPPVPAAARNPVRSIRPAPYRPGSLDDPSVLMRLGGGV